MIQDHHEERLSDLGKEAIKAITIDPTTPVSDKRVSSIMERGARRPRMSDAKFKNADLYTRFLLPT